VEYLFGEQPALNGERSTSPQRAALSVRAAYLSKTLRIPLQARQKSINALEAALMLHGGADSTQRATLEARLAQERKEASGLRSALTFIKPGVRIDGRTGNAMPDHLFMDEMARPGAVLEADCQLDQVPMDDNQNRAAVALLCGSTRLVERLGGRRRRGAGECVLEILAPDNGAAVEIDSAIHWLDSATAPPLPDWRDSSERQLPRLDGSSDDWIVVPLVLELVTPLAVTRQVVGNVAEMHDFVPGTVLLPVIAKSFRNLGFDLRSAFARGDVRVLHATLGIDDLRGEPVPFCLYAKKGGDGFNAPDTNLVNRLVQGDHKQPQLKQVREGYLVRRTDGHGILHVGYERVPKAVLTHNTVEDQKQRPTSAVGGVYSYEAIAPTDNGEPVRLRSELWLRQNVCNELREKKPEWWKDFNAEIRLGRSSKDDYGRVQCRASEPADAVDSPTLPTGEYLFVRVLSDVLLRNDCLRHETSQVGLKTVLQTALGVVLCDKPYLDNHEFLQAAMRARRLDSWHSKWVLPRPSLIGIQAGSCAVFKVQGGPIKPENLRRVEHEGLGERRAEGYGQVRFNDPILVKESKELRAWPPKKPLGGSEPPGRSEAAISSEAPVHDYAQLIEREVWRAGIRRQVLDATSTSEKRRKYFGWTYESEGTRSKPSMSQLGGLRAVVQRMRSLEDKHHVLSWLDAVKANPRRYAVWTAEPSTEGAHAKMHTLISDQEGVWRILQCNAWATLTVHAKERLKKELWAEAVRALVLAGMQAQKREEERRQSMREVGDGA
jgi:CRISPR-associated protein Csx10